jgi:hypothetical protein
MGSAGSICLFWARCLIKYALYDTCDRSRLIPQKKPTMLHQVHDDQRQ